MKPQFDNKVMSSFFLWFDNKLLKKGEAFENVTGQFYDSITGATIPTGLYVGDNLVNVSEGGSDGLFAINYNEGRAYFSGDQSSDVTGSFAIKDFNVFLTNQPEDKILFETKYTSTHLCTRENTVR